MGKIKELVNSIKLDETGLIDKEESNNIDSSTYKIIIDSIGSFVVEKKYIDFLPIMDDCEPLKLNEIIKFAYDVYCNEKNRLKNYFEENEVILILDVFNGHMGRISSFFKESLLYNISDAINYRNLDEEYNVNKDKIINKIASLTYTQSVVLILMTQEFWNSKEDQTKELMKKIFC
ncbi:hypothetical protein ONV75_16585 [Clostridium sp. LQ25]|jgi:hypothetical protein|uniref:hypothetical protein n=1 Tax=Clostridium sp. LQ25 TaxID=2992805 RepID=UPI00224FFFDA|nr:hypothetical protein [Clostridium sp. LQ25]UZT06198.1 hypothetical protein ONV75_16585 [Clostridium sp. LQ25]